MMLTRGVNTLFQYHVHRIACRSIFGLLLRITQSLGISLASHLTLACISKVASLPICDSHFAELHFHFEY